MDGDRPLDGRPPRICVVTATTEHSLAAEEIRYAITQRDERSNNTIRSQSRHAGAAANYPAFTDQCKSAQRYLGENGSNGLT
jgi:hypothetical protein